MPVLNEALRQEVLNRIRAGQSDSQIRKETGYITIKAMREIEALGLPITTRIRKDGSLNIEPRKPPKTIEEKRESRRIWEAKRKAKIELSEVNGDNKICTKCHACKPTSEFPNSRNQCKACRDKRNRKKELTVKPVKPAAKYDTLALDKTKKFGSAYATKKEEVDVPNRASQSLTTFWLRCPVGAKCEFISKIESLLTDWRNAS